MAQLMAATQHTSLLEQLRQQYEAARVTTTSDEVEDFESIDARLRKAFRWLEQAITYLNAIKPAIEHRFDLGYGYAFESPRFSQGSVSQQQRRIRGYPVLEEVGVYYEIAASRPLTIEVASGWVSFAEKTLDAFGLQYSRRHVAGPDGSTRNCIFSVPPVIPARISLRPSYQTGVVTVALFNVDRLDRVSLEFQSTAIDEPLLEDLVRLVLGRDSAFLRRARLAGLRRAAQRVA
jgi:hypothetical protein